ncbi:Heavy metal-associated domain superfamily [Arabidopsis suecica]|uniref:Heavy metal-associated domain superfamily n=1 Tax=Arabidopsis suecica TaxID=45249 RepID=A0A8T2B9L9_ARASU|nr:Heavy metal-associated domain superfamily [Arabidopsis suecica]
MGKLQKIGRVWDCFFLPKNQCSCFCLNTLGDDEEEVFEKKPLIDSSAEKSGKVMRLKDVVAADYRQTLAFHLKPKIVELKVSMHCYGCAKKVEKHISKLDGVTWYKVELESKKVVVKGNIMPVDVLESICKVKNAQLWSSSP